MEIVQTDFASPLGELALALRVAVFVVEQGVPPEMEIDEYDAGAVHFVARHAENVVGTFRIVTHQHDGKRAAKIGRVAVVRELRGQGVGRQMMHAAIAFARSQKFSECILTAQVPVIGFYELLGFVAEGPVFDDCGIPHRWMRMALT